MLFEPQGGGRSQYGLAGMDAGSTGRADVEGAARLRLQEDRAAAVRGHRIEMPGGEGERFALAGRRHIGDVVFGDEQDRSPAFRPRFRFSRSHLPGFRHQA